MDRKTDFNPLPDSVTPISRATSAQAHGFPPDTAINTRPEIIATKSVSEIIESTYQLLAESDLSKSAISKIMELTLIDIEEVEEEGIIKTPELPMHIVQILILKNVLLSTTIGEVESSRVGPISQSKSALTTLLQAHPILLRYVDEMPGYAMKTYIKDNPLLQYLDDRYEKTNKPIVQDALNALMEQILMLVSALNVHHIHKVDKNYWKEMIKKYRRELRYIDNTK